jgi:uncharacterized short protein YbdD (DUF466 family)
MKRALYNGISTLVLDAHAGLRALARTARLMCGVADYDAYIAHRRARHPGQPTLSYEAFFKERQQARYGAGAVRCC